MLTIAFKVPLAINLDRFVVELTTTTAALAFVSQIQSYSTRPHRPQCGRLRSLMVLQEIQSFIEPKLVHILADCHQLAVTPDRLAVDPQRHRNDGGVAEAVRELWKLA